MELDTLPAKTKRNFFFFFKKIALFQQPFQESDASPRIEKFVESDERQQINEQIDFFIKTKDLENLSIFINEEVRLTEKQIYNILTDKENDFLWGKSQIGYGELRDRFFNINRQSIQTVIEKMLLQTYKLLDKPNRLIDGKKNYEYKDEYISHFSDLRCLGHWVHLTKDSIYQTDTDTDKDKISQLYTLAMKTHDKIKDDSRNVFDLTRGSLKNDYTEIFQNLYSKSITLDTKVLAQRAKEIDLQSVSKIIDSDIANTMKKFDIKSLPLEAQKIFQEISENLNEIAKHKNSFNQQEILHLENIQHKRLPQVLQEYISIPERYKKQLNEGPDKPDALLLDSLHEINKALSPFINTFKENSINEMKKTNKYLKSMGTF